MADFPYNEASKFTSYGTSGATSAGTTVTAAGTAHVKGSWAELTASTTADSSGIIISIIQVDALAVSLIDIGIGAAGSETVLIPNLFLRSTVGTGSPTTNHTVYLPIRIPAGTRVAARAQSGTISIGYRISIILVSGCFASFPAFTKCVGLGPDTTTSGISNITTNSVAANTESAYSELVASTTFPIKAILPVFAITGGLEGANTLVDLAIGAAGSETVIIPNFSLRSDSTNPQMNHYGAVIPCSIPSGTRVAWREQSSTTGASHLIHFAIYGLG